MKHQISFSVWRARNPDLDNECEDCNGFGVVDCKDCDGEGYRYCRDTKNCPGCSECECWCDEGSVNCNECLGYGNTGYPVYAAIRSREMRLLKKNEVA